MKFKADEIASVIQKEIEDFRGLMQTAEVGRVIEVGDGIARCTGLSTAMSGDGMSGFPKPRSMTSSPSRRAVIFRLLMIVNTYGGRLLMRRKSTTEA